MYREDIFFLQVLFLVIVVLTGEITILGYGPHSLIHSPGSVLFYIRVFILILVVVYWGTHSLGREGDTPDHGTCISPVEFLAGGYTSGCGPGIIHFAISVSGGDSLRQ